MANRANFAPVNWKVMSLEELTESKNISYGIVQPGSNDPEGIPIIRVNNFSSNGLDTSNVSRVSPDIEKKFSKTRLRLGDVLLTLVGSTGQTYVIPDKYVGWNVPRALAVIRPNSIVSSEWIKICLDSQHTKQFLDSRANTTVQKTLNLSDVKKIPIPIPPGRERAFIETCAVDLNKKLYLNSEVNQTLEQMAQAMFKSWFVDFDPVIDNALAVGNPIPDELQERAELRQRVIAERATNPKLKPLPDGIQQLFPSEFEESELGWIPKGWFSGALASLVRYSTSRMDGSKLTLENYISTENMLTNKQGVTKASSIPSLKSAPSFITGQVLISNIRPYFKKIWLATSNGGRSNDVLGFELLEPKTEAYLMNLLSQDQFFDFMMTTSKGSKMPRGDKKAIMDWGVVVPPVKIRKFYSNLVGDFYSANSIRTKENDSLVQLRDTLLPKLISGEVILESQIHHADGV
jgi:type I restriction enzyme S subunit